MKYKVDRDLMEAGIEMLLREKINQLELNINNRDTTMIKVSLREYQEASKIARSVLVNTSQYDNDLLSKEDELKKEWGIILK